MSFFIQKTTTLDEVISYKKQTSSLQLEFPIEVSLENHLNVFFIQKTTEDEVI